MLTCLLPAYTCRWLSPAAASGPILLSACGIDGVALSVRSAASPVETQWNCLDSRAAGGCPQGAPGASFTLDVSRNTFYNFVVSGDAAVGASLDVRVAPPTTTGSWTNPFAITTLTSTTPFVSPAFNASGSVGGGIGQGTLQPPPCEEEPRSQG